MHTVIFYLSYNVPQINVCSDLLLTIQCHWDICIQWSYTCPKMPLRHMHSASDMQQYTCMQWYSSWPTMSLTCRYRHGMIFYLTYNVTHTRIQTWYDLLLDLLCHSPSDTDMVWSSTWPTRSLTLRHIHGVIFSLIYNQCHYSDNAFIEKVKCYLRLMKNN